MKMMWHSEPGYLAFSKMSGHGNDFIVVDNMSGEFDIAWYLCARQWCERRRSIGADGILVLEPSDQADFNLRIFNADGSEAEMCGNGARCAAAFALERNIADSPLKFETLAGIIEALVDEKNVSIKLTDVQKSEGGRIITLERGRVVPFHFIDSGVPHAVIFMKDAEDASVLKGPLMAIRDDDIREIGREVRFHSLFSPRGANVDFVEIVGPDRIRVRTYERGVEGETLACGTGIVASAIAAAMIGGTTVESLTVEVAGGELSVRFRDQNSYYSDVWLSGEISWVYEGLAPLHEE